MQNKFSAIVIESISVLLIFLFVYAAISKIITHDLFVYTLSKSPLLKKINVGVSWIIPSSEILISLFLLIPRWRRTGLFFSIVIMILFTFYIGYMIAFTPQLPCSCGGVLKELTWRQHLLFNIFFTVVAFAGWFLSKRNKDFIAINRISRTPV